VSGGAGPLGPDRGAHSSGRDLLRALGTPNARLALVVLTVTNLVMVAIMVIAPVRMMAHGDGLDVIGLVISIHVIGMFGPSPFSGWLADRVGPEAVAACGGVLVGAAGVAGGFVDMRSPSAMMAVLAVLGVGWNFGIVGGSTLLAGSVPGPVRPRVEGIGEVATSLAAAVGAPAAGLVAALAGFAALSLTAAAMSVAVLAVLAQQSRRPARRLPERAAAVAAGPEH